MLPWEIVLRPLDNPVKALVVIFLTWKALLLLVALSSPGPGYDTSTTLYDEALTPETSFLPALLNLLSTKLTRWDAIYFTKSANRGYLYEQEWAFGWGMTRLISFFAQDLREVGFDYHFVESIVGITISHASHGCSVLVLYCLGTSVLQSPSGRKLSFTAACLHILSPGGLFLSAPNGEATFSLLAFSGCFFFVQSFRGSRLVRDLAMVVAGVLFGVSATVRSNGLTYGFLFAEEAVRVAYSLKDDLNLFAVRRLASTGLGGIAIAVGFLLPQYIAYQDLCGENPSVWCSKALPSVYTYIQDHYWGVGFLRYWVVPNIPLFILAMPMLAIMATSSIWTLQRPKSLVIPGSQVEPQLEDRLLRSLAVPQLFVAVTALTTYHVQIITRISSGYPLWYFWLATMLTNRKVNAPINLLATLCNGELIVKYMMMYAIVQGGLYASFLPPA